MQDWIAPSSGRLSVSLIYNIIMDCITKPLSIKFIWNRELFDLNLSVDWERVWSNLSLTSKNLAHRLIHFKVIHRAYITPYKDSKWNYNQLVTVIYVTLHHQVLFFICFGSVLFSLIYGHMWAWFCPPCCKLVALLAQVSVFLMVILVSL